MAVPAKIPADGGNGGDNARIGGRLSARELPADAASTHRRPVALARVNGVRQGESGEQRDARQCEGSTGWQPPATGPQVLGYATMDVGQSERAKTELRRQVEAIASECERRGMHLLVVVREHDRQHQRPLDRPGLGYALAKIAASEADGLVVADLPRLTHSVPELGRVLDWLCRRGARFVAACPGLDTDEEAGRLAVQTIIEVAQWERQRLVERTRNGMRAARRKGPASVADDPQLKERIAQMRAAGMTLQSVADQLNAEGVPTVRGGAKWRPSSVQAAAGYRRPPAGRAFDPASGNARAGKAEAGASQNGRRARLSA